MSPGDGSPGTSQRPRGWATWPPGRRPRHARRPSRIPPAVSSWARVALLIGALVAIGVWAGVWALVIVGALIVIVVLHELGHFLTARWAGMKVSEFYVGFGPRLWSVQRGETTYGIKAIWAGAYVRILGMNNLEKWSTPPRSTAPTGPSRTGAACRWLWPAPTCTSCWRCC